MNSAGDSTDGPAEAAPPRILYIYREFWKTGSQAALDRIETEAARMCIELGCPHPYLGIESLTGSKEVWYLNGFSSIEEQEHVRQQYARRDLFTTMSQFAQRRDPFKSETGKEAYSNYRPDMSRGTPWSLGKGRFLVILVTKSDPRGDATVFEAEDGMRFIVLPAESREEANRKLSDAGPGAKVFAVRPQFSMPARDWVAADPSFWASSHNQQ